MNLYFIEGFWQTPTVFLETERRIKEINDELTDAKNENEKLSMESEIVRKENEKLRSEVNQLWYVNASFWLDCS
jgi:F0F1-type ATP synthase membrane subunit b/b'